MRTMRPFFYLLCATLMLVTRGSHFGSLVHVPDASWAIFFVVGAVSRSSLPFVALLAEAALVDLFALSHGVGAACITPAYVALVPAYGTLFLAGRMASRLEGERLPRLLGLGALALSACVVCFLISSGAYYAVAVAPRGTPLDAYAASSLQHLGKYLLVMTGYVVAFLPIAHFARLPLDGRATVDAR